MVESASDETNCAITKTTGWQSKINDDHASYECAAQHRDDRERRAKSAHDQGTRPRLFRILVDGC